MIFTYNKEFFCIFMTNKVVYNFFKQKEKPIEKKIKKFCAV